MVNSIFSMLLESFLNLSFVSITFIVFVLVLFLVYYIVPKKLQWVVLLVASLFFYATYGTRKLVFILAATLIAWLGGRRIKAVYDAQASYNADRKEAAKLARGKARRVLTICVALIVAMLLYCKIGKWAIEEVTRVLTGKRIEATVWVALGVSYYSFSLIGYLVEVYWGNDEPEKNYFRLLLFSAYFPKVLQGPISRRKNLAPQLREPHPYNDRDFTFGIQRMCWGYFKKMVIADRLVILVNTVFGMRSPAGAYVLVATVFTAFQSYCDFSGCMDIVLGLSESLGLKLEENFNHPFFSRSAAEFWRRWHITLGTWFKDYVYAPLILSRKLINPAKKIKKRFGLRASKAMMMLVSTYAVWILTGLWHATGLNYLAWGLMWATVIGLSTIFDPEIKKLTQLLHINTGANSWRIFQMVRTFGLYCFGRLIAAPGDLKVTGMLIRNLFTKFQPWLLTDGSLYTLGLDRPNFLLAIVCLLLLGFVSIREEQGVHLRESIASSNIIFQWAIYYGLFFAILIFGIYGPGYNASDFVYMKF